MPGYKFFWIVAFAIIFGSMGWGANRDSLPLLILWAVSGALVGWALSAADDKRKKKK